LPRGGTKRNERWSVSGQIDEIIRLIRATVSGGESLEYARRIARAAYSQSPELVEQAFEELERRQATIRQLRDPVVVEDLGVIRPWYTGPSPSDQFWPAFTRALVADGFDEALLDETGDVGGPSSKLVSYLAPPGSPEIDTKGLVVGHVQSGKTTNFTAVAAKAADTGYRLFIVLSGVHDALRAQTQRRLEKHLLNKEVLPRWFNLTEEGDFASPGNAASFLASSEHRSIAVVKKNGARLRRLNKWLESAPTDVLANCPILVIDDEADQASIDVGRTRRSAINKEILKILRHPKAAYIAYTATPFANLLIDPQSENLYPKDFIADLPRPADHMGTEVIFGRLPVDEDDTDSDLEGLDVVRHVPEDEIVDVRPPSRKVERETWSPVLTPSLERAINYFLIATAARRVRSGEREHSSMLIHTSMFVDCQLALRGPVAEALASARTAVERGRLGVLEALWSEEQERVPASSLELEPVPFDHLVTELSGVLDDVRVVVDNSRSDDRLEYDDAAPVPVIAIGGNTLSRGLTLEGLAVSYFVRSASTYDTLLQMGRWFGYRPGYKDLPRVWMTADLHQWFIHLATVEHEIRSDIARYEKLRKTPMELAVRIRQHPAMAVTSKAKMRDAVQTRVSYAGSRLQTFLFEHENAAWLKRNLGAAQNLVLSARSIGIEPEERKRGWWMLPAVPTNLVVRFLEEYQSHENHADLDRKALTEYIEQQRRKGSLNDWNVVIAGRADAKVGDIDLGLPKRVNLLVRSRLNIEGLPYANIKALMSKVDRVADLPELDQDASSLSDAELQSRRPRDIGLLVLYPIDRRSPPTQTAQSDGPPPVRVALDAVEDVIGIGLVFPDADDSTPVTYVSANLPAEELEAVEEEMKAEEDEVAAYDLRDEEELGRDEP